MHADAAASSSPGRLPEAGKLLSAVFLGTVLMLLLAFSPGRIAPMGYTPEVLEAGRRLLDRGTAILTGRPEPQEALTLPRHGLGEVVAALPFLGAARLAFGPSAEWADHLLSFQPVLSTALICTVLFVWVTRLTASPALGAMLGLLAAFSTMLWPYAYIGLETTQSLFLLLAALLALEAPGRPTWTRSLLFAGCAAVAVSIKTASVFLVPSVAWLSLCLFRRDAAATGQRRSRVPLQALSVASIVAAVWILNAWTRVRFWRTAFKVDWVVAGPMDFLLQAWSALLSGNKGLLLFSPVLALALLGLDAAFTRHPRLVTFAVLVLAGQVVGSCLIVYWSDETWGPRYLHSSIAPLVLCLAAARSGRPLRVRREAPLLFLGLAGTLVSLLGSLFWYGHLFQAAGPALVSTVENYQYDFDLNHIRFNARLARLWLEGEHSATEDRWPPPQKIWYARNTPPAGFRPRQQVSLRPFAVPQPAVLQPVPFRQRAFWLATLALGTVGLAWLARLVRRA